MDTSMIKDLAVNLSIGRDVAGPYAIGIAELFGAHVAGIADAMPRLARAGAIEVVMVASERQKSDDIPGADIGQHLARHGLTVEVKRIVATDTDVANTILSHAADSSADLLVMGGYGHS